MFQELNEKISSLNDLFNSFAEIFNFNSLNNDFLSYLNNISVPTNQVCAKTISVAWRCYDCEKDSTCIICTECYEKSEEKHKNHKVIFKSNCSGCCDCGDPDAWDVNGFCSDHQGSFKNDSEIENYINKCFTDKTLLNKIYEKINEIFEKVFLILLEIENLEKETLSGHVITNFFNFLNKICMNNNGLNQIVCMYLVKNFNLDGKILAKHQCIIINDKFDVEFIDNNENNDVNKICKCSLIKLIFSFPVKNINDKLFYNFLHNYKLKNNMGILFIVFII